MKEKAMAILTIESWVNSQISRVITIFTSDSEA